MSAADIFKNYKINQNKGKKRKLYKFITKAKMTVKDKTIGQSSNLEIHCSNKNVHRTPMTHLLQRIMQHKKGRIGRPNTNLLIMLTPFIAGIRATEMADIANVLDLPNAKYLERSLHRHKPEIVHAIIKS